MITADQLIVSGYIKYVDRSRKQFTDVLYQKRIDDEHGKKYFINVYEWDNRQYKCHGRMEMDDFSYNAEAQMTDMYGSTFSMEMMSPESIEKIEAFIESVWQSLNCEYYEEWK